MEAAAVGTPAVGRMVDATAAEAVGVKDGSAAAAVREAVTSVGLVVGEGRGPTVPAGVAKVFVALAVQIWSSGTTGGTTLFPQAQPSTAPSGT